jgi:GntR family carbon starvation induced transcriptional regulator
MEAVDMHAMDERHYQFHRALIAHCGSPRLLDLSDQLYIETQRYRLPCLIGPMARMPARDVAAEHQQIMDAALRRSEDAVRHLAEHYRRTAEIIEASTVWPSEA